MLLHPVLSSRHVQTCVQTFIQCLDIITHISHHWCPTQYSYLYTSEHISGHSFSTGVSPDMYLQLSCPIPCHSLIQLHPNMYSDTHPKLGLGGVYVGTLIQFCPSIMTHSNTCLDIHPMLGCIRITIAFCPIMSCVQGAFRHVQTHIQYLHMFEHLLRH